MASIRQIARALNVSPMTVSFVLNNKAGEVSAETREKVLRAVREMGYRPKAAAHKKESKNHTLGISAGVPNASFIQDGYFTAILHQLMAIAEARGLNILLFHRSVFHADREDAIRTYLDGHCEGLILLAPWPHLGLIPALTERGVPFVCIGATFDELGKNEVAFVDIDNRAAFRDATERLIEMGHRRMAFVGDEDGGAHGAFLRGDGWREALEAAEIPVNPAFLYSKTLQGQEMEIWLEGVAGRPEGERPTAILAWNDVTAQRILAFLRKTGRDVPGQFSVIGMDDDPSSAVSDPPLTTVRQPYAAIAAAAVDALQSRIRDRRSPPARILLPCELILRGSTAIP